MFAFGNLTIILSATQVFLSYEQLDPHVQKTLRSRMCQGFSIWIIMSVVGLVVFLIVMLVYKISREWVWTLKRRYECKKGVI